MPHNTYFILEPPYKEIQNIIRVCVGRFEDQRANLDGTKLVVKLPEYDNPNRYNFLKGLPQYTHAEILQIINSPEWVQNI